MLQGLAQVFAQGQTKPPVRSPCGHSSDQSVSPGLFRKNNSDRMGASSGDIAQEILLVQTGQIEIAQHDIRHNPGEKLLELLDGCAITDEMRLAPQQFLERRPVRRIRINNKNRTFFYTNHRMVIPFRPFSTKPWWRIRKTELFSPS